MISFNVVGIPQPQGSKKFVGRAKSGRGIMVESNDKTLKPWREAVVNRAAEVWKGRPALAGAVEVTVVFRFPRPKGHYGSGRNAHTLNPSAPYWKSGKPDLDKYLRAVLDALTEAGVYRDDGQVARFHDPIKRYCFAGETPGASIAVAPLEAVDGVAAESAA